MATLPKVVQVLTNKLHLIRCAQSDETRYFLVAPCGTDIRSVVRKITQEQFKHLRKHQHLSVYENEPPLQSESVKAGIAKRKAGRDAKNAKSAQDYSDLCSAIMRRPKTPKGK